MEKSEINELAIIQRASEGSREAFGWLVRRYEQKVFALAWSVLRRRSDAEDAAQEAFIRAFGAMGSFRTGAPFGPWIARIAVNTALSAAKSRQRRLRLLESAPSAPPAQTHAFSEELEAALGELKPRQRLALELFHRDGATYEEIGDMLGTSVGQVKNFLHRGRRKLKKILRTPFGGEI